jgi:hypothetical protein
VTWVPICLQISKPTSLNNAGVCNNFKMVMHTLANQTNIFDPFLLISILTLYYEDTLIPPPSPPSCQVQVSPAGNIWNMKMKACFRSVCILIKIFWYIQVTHRQHTVLYCIKISLFRVSVLSHRHQTVMYTVCFSSPSRFMW